MIVLLFVVLPSTHYRYAEIGEPTHSTAMPRGWSGRLADACAIQNVESGERMLSCVRDVR